MKKKPKYSNRVTPKQRRKIVASLSEPAPAIFLHYAIFKKCKTWRDVLVVAMANGIF